MAAVDDLTELVERAAAAEKSALASKWKDEADVQALISRSPQGSRGATAGGEAGHRSGPAVATVGGAAAELSRSRGATCAAGSGAVDAGRPRRRGRRGDCLGGSAIRPRLGRNGTRWPPSAWLGWP